MNNLELFALMLGRAERAERETNEAIAVAREVHERFELEPALWEAHRLAVRLSRYGWCEYGKCGEMDPEAE